MNLSVVSLVVWDPIMTCLSSPVQHRGNLYGRHTRFYIMPYKCLCGNCHYMQTLPTTSDQSNYHQACSSGAWTILSKYSSIWAWCTKSNLTIHTISLHPNTSQCFLDVLKQTWRGHNIINWSSNFVPALFQSFHDIVPL